ncbi:TetR/AcrR family transcriptional regulator [Rhodopseudomonas palustris]|uniref:Transcriptional regulator, TetR family n=1 Tax=Rhodopseudomonas palustris (strain BisB18) TaxID=316056 RepID=Q21A36_RHOPB
MPHAATAIRDPKENRKARQILDAARALFLTHGFDASSMEAIAREAGVSKATLYVHFASKDDLLLALVDDECRRLGPQTLWQPDGAIDVERDLQAIARGYTAFFLHDRGRGLHRLVIGHAQRFPQMAEVFMIAGPLRCEAEVAAFLRAAEAQGLLRIPDVPLAAVQFLNLVQGRLQLQWELSMEPPNAADYEALIEGGIRVFLAAYGAPPRDEHRAGQHPVS